MDQDIWETCSLSRSRDCWEGGFIITTVIRPLTVIAALKKTLSSQLNFYGDFLMQFSCCIGSWLQEAIIMTPSKTNLQWFSIVVIISACYVKGQGLIPGRTEKFFKINGLRLTPWVKATTIKFFLSAFFWRQELLEGALPWVTVNTLNFFLSPLFSRQEKTLGH